MPLMTTDREKTLSAASSASAVFPWSESVTIEASLTTVTVGVRGRKALLVNGVSGTPHPASRFNDEMTNGTAWGR